MSKAKSDIKQLTSSLRANVVIARQISFVSDLEPIPGATGFDPEGGSGPNYGEL